MNLRPLQDFLLVQIDPANDKSVGGLYIPENTDKPRMCGTVLAVGPDVKALKVGDKVYVTYRDAFATSVTDTWIFPEKNILAVVE